MHLFTDKSELRGYQLDGITPPVCLSLSDNPDDPLTRNPLFENGKLVGTQPRSDLIRILVPDSYGEVPWQRFKRNLLPEIRCAYEGMLANGSKHWEWFMTRRAIPATEWLGVEEYRDGQWMKVD